MLEITVPYYLGIDGGGTKTTCAVGDESRLLATATAGPSNIVRAGEAEARESLQQSVRQACAAAGVTPAQISQTCVGGSGAARPELAEIVRRSLAEILPTPIQVVGDMQIALEAAFDTGPGVIVIAGTGSIACGRDRQGTTLRAGGWGFAIGDEGSAHWIGRAAVKAVLRAADPCSVDPSRVDPRPSIFTPTIFNRAIPKPPAAAKKFMRASPHRQNPRSNRHSPPRSKKPGASVRSPTWPAPPTQFPLQISPLYFPPSLPVKTILPCRSYRTRAGNSRRSLLLCPIVFFRKIKAAESQWP